MLSIIELINVLATLFCLYIIYDLVFSKTKTKSDYQTEAVIA